MSSIFFILFSDLSRSRMYLFILKGWDFIIRALLNIVLADWELKDLSHLRPIHKVYSCFEALGDSKFKELICFFEFKI